MTSQELHTTQDDFHGDVRWCLKDEAPTDVLSRAVQQEVAKIAKIVFDTRQDEDSELAAKLSDLEARCKAHATKEAEAAKDEVTRPL